MPKPTAKPQRKGTVLFDDTDDTPDPVADDPEPDDDNTVADDDTNGGPADAVAVDTVLRFRPEELPDNYDNGQPHLSARAHVVAPSAYLHNAASPAPPESLLRASTHS